MIGCPTRCLRKTVQAKNRHVELGVEVSRLLAHRGGSVVEIFDIFEAQLLLEALEDEHFGHAKAKWRQVTLLLRQSVFLTEFGCPLVQRLLGLTLLRKVVLDETLPLFIDPGHRD